MAAVLISTWTYPPQKNGVAHVAQAHATGLAELGHEVTVVTSYDPDRKNGDGKVEVVEFDVGGRWAPRKMFNPFWGDIESYRRFISRYPGDVVLFHGCTVWNTDLILRMLPQIKPKAVLISHGVSFNNGSFLSRLAWRPYVWQLHRIYKTFDHVVFLTNKSDRGRFFDKHIITRHGFKRWSVIPNGTYPRNFCSDLPDFRAICGIKKNAKMLLCVAGFNPQKNQEYAMRAFIKAGAIDAAMVFIGDKMNTYVKNLQAKVQGKASDRNRFVFLSGLERQMIDAAYRAADLFLHPSKTEAQPLVVLDAMASGTPFISTDVGCVGELSGGITVKSEEEMADAIRCLLNDSAKYELLKREGMLNCKEVYNWKIIAKRYENLILNLATKGG